MEWETHGLDCLDGVGRMDLFDYEGNTRMSWYHPICWKIVEEYLSEVLTPNPLRD